MVVANPPFSLKKWGAENAAGDPYGRFWRGVPPPSKGDYAFITHMIEIAERRSGRVAVIVPHGVLFRGHREGRHPQGARRRESSGTLSIGLPPKLFTTTGIPVAILVFDRSREEGGANEDRVDVPLYRRQQGVHARKETETSWRRSTSRRWSRTYRKREVIERYSHVAVSEEIIENDYNLNIPRYVDTFEPEEEIDIAEVQRDIDKIEAELVEVRAKMRGYLRELGVEV